MSIPCDPDLYDYSVAPNVCPVCFDADKTPDSIFVNIQGVAMGQAVPGVDPDPPNGTWELPVTGPCAFGAVFGPWTFSLTYNGPETLFTVQAGGVGFGFGAGDPGNCTNWLANAQQFPLVDDYYGGFANFVPYLEGGEFSAEQLLELVVVEPGDHTYAKPRPHNDGDTVYVITQRSTNSNIAVKYEPP